MEAVECGAACLAMVLATHGRHVPLEELRSDCGVSRDGSKASNIVRAGRRHGMESRGFKKAPSSLEKIEMPSILHWNFNHFVVLEGFDGDRVFLNDPALGPRVVDKQELDESFTGVVLTFQPNEAFEAGGESPSLITSLRPRLKGSMLAVVYALIVGLALVVPGLIAPAFSKIFVDQILVGGLWDWGQPLLLFMAATTAVAMVLTWLRQFYLLRLETKLSLSTSSSFFWHILRLPIDFFSQRFGGEIGSRVAINNRVASLLSGKLAVTLLSLLVVGFYALLMLQYDVLLACVGFTVASLNVVALKYVSEKRRLLNQRLLKDRGQLLGTTMSGFQMIETLKATGSEDDFFTRWSGYQAKAVNAEEKLAIYTQMLAVVPPFLLAVNVALILGFGGMKIMDGAMSIGLLIAFNALALSFIQPVNQLVQVGSIIQEVEGDMSRLDDVLNYEADVPSRIAAGMEDKTVHSSGDGAPVDPEVTVAEVVRLDGRLDVDDITFGYSRLDPPLIESLSLSVSPGSRVALVGGSGSGKSTIARLVCGLYEVWNGEILFDGQTRADLSRSVMSNSFALVNQDIFVFEGTVRDNLTMWDTTIPEQDILRAAQDACIHDAIVSRPLGYDSIVKEGGRNFSGGQRQRLEIARALARDPALLVLDEATSALDPATEKHIDDNLRRRGCTCLIVAHRLSTIRDCDEIIVLDGGRVVQRGTHDNMIAEGGPYADLLQHQ